MWFTLNGSNDNGYRSLVLQSSVFTSNKVVSVQVVQTCLHLTGSVLFEQNQATDGAGIFCNNSTITFTGVYFTNNSADSTMKTWYDKNARQRTSKPGVGIVANSWSSPTGSILWPLHDRGES